MLEWDRTTPWRQGHIISREAMDEIGLWHSESPERTAVLLISHDCDLAQPPETEPQIELIVGQFIDETDGNFSHAKNVRTLHLPVTRGEAKAVVELRAKDKLHIEKARLVGHIPIPEFGLAAAELSILQRWLAARYRRSAFPDGFEDRLDESGLRERLAKALKAHGAQIPAIFFDVDDGLEVPHDGPNDAYALAIFLLYDTQADPEVSRAAAEQAKQAIEGAFRSRCYSDKEGWRFIELRECSVVSDEALTYAQSCQLQRWYTDHISLRSDPHQSMLVEA